MLNIIKYDNANALEATWTKTITLPQNELADGSADLALRTQEVQIASIAYADTQMDLLRADVLKYGGDITTFETLIADVESNIQPYVEPVKTLEELAEAVRVALQSAINDKSKSFGFSGGNALMLYAGFVNPFQPLAQTFATWEALVWYEAELYKAEVFAGTKPMLTGVEAVAMMPVYPA